jgi:hypothetical protein
MLSLLNGRGDLLCLGKVFDENKTLGVVPVISVGFLVVLNDGTEPVNGFPPGDDDPGRFVLGFFALDVASTS